MHWPKCEDNNKDEDNSLNTLNNKNYQASSKKFKHNLQLFSIKYSYPILVIFKHIYLTNRWDSNKYYHHRVSLRVIVQ